MLAARSPASSIPVDKYEFGVKCTLAVINARAAGGQFVLGAKTIPGTPWDGYTLATQIDQVEALTGRRVRRAYVDRGYCRHKLVREGVDVFVTHTCGIASPTIRRELRRRSAIEPVMGHMKTDGLLERNHLAGVLGDAINAVLIAAGHNLRLLATWPRKLLFALIALLIAITTPSPCRHHAVV